MEPHLRKILWKQNGGTIYGYIENYEWMDPIYEIHQSEQSGLYLVNRLDIKDNASSFLPAIQTNSDLAELKIAIQNDFEQLAYDSLTHVFSRIFFRFIFENEIQLAKKNDLPLSFLIINVDYFKRFNDTYGHAQGDAALVCIASMIQAGLAQNCFLTRSGGDNFSVIIPRKGVEEANDVATRICNSVSNQQFINGSQLTISIGVGGLESKKDTWEDIFCRADINIYSAKLGGRNRVVVKNT